MQPHSGTIALIFNLLNISRDPTSGALPYGVGDVSSIFNSNLDSICGALYHIIYNFFYSFIKKIKTGGME